MLFHDGAADGVTRGDSVGSGLGACVGVPEVGCEDGCDDIDGCHVGFGEIVGVAVGVEDGDDVGLLDIVGDEVVELLGLSVGEMIAGVVVDVALLDCVEVF